MEDYQIRVIEEKQELDAKLEKLKFFVKETRFDNLPLAEQQRLKRQLGIMQDYSQVLGERIEGF